jgi:hypothetical protein
MPFSRQELERRQQRDEARRQEALARRQEEDRDRAREEARREEARQERLAFEAQLEADRSHRAALIARIRDERRRERVAAERSAEQQAAVVERIRVEADQRQRAAAAAAETRERLREAAALAHRRDDRRATKAAGRVAGAVEARRNARRRAQNAEVPSPGGRGAAPGAPTTKRIGGGQDERVAQQQRAKARDQRAERLRRDAATSDRTAAARESLRARRSEEARTQRTAEERQSQARARIVADRREIDRKANVEAERAAARQARLADERAAAQRAASERARRRPEPTARQASPSPVPPRDPLEDPIPSGAMSGSLPWLRVAGARLETAAGQRVTLRGAGVVGLGQPARGHDLVAAGLDSGSLESLLGLGIRAAVVPIDRDRFLAGAGGMSADDHLVELDRAIGQLASGGAYTILSLRTLGDATFGSLPDGSGGSMPNPIPPQPDHESIGLWRSLAERYADEPAVLYDLFGAPHAPLPDDASGIETGWDRWSLWARLTLAEMRLVHPRAVAIVAGLEWGTDLSGFPLVGSTHEPIPNVLYGAVISAGRQEPQLRALAGRLPILVTQLGVPAASVPQRAAALGALGIGWIASPGPDRALIAPARGARLEPTIYGSSVQRAIASIPEDPLLAARPRPSSAFATAV